MRMKQVVHQSRREVLSAVNRFALLCAAACAAGGLCAASPSPEDTASTVVELVGDVTFSAAEGTTVTYRGKYTGTGTAVIDGGGTVVFTNPDNSYSGGTRVQNAVFRVNATGAAGTGTISNMANTAHLYINCPRLVNDVYFATGYKFGSPTAAPAWGDGMYAIYPGMDTVLEGSIEAAGSSDEFCFQTGYGTGVKNRLEITGDLKGRVHVGIALFGDVSVGGRLLCGSSGKYELRCDKNYRCKGTLTLNSSSNLTTRVLTYNGKYELKAKDALPGAELFWKYDSGSASDPNANVYYLHGNDQTFGGLGWRTSSGYLRPGEDWEGWGIYAGSSPDDTAPATVRFTGEVPSKPASYLGYDLWAGLFGNLTYILDAPSPTRAGWYQNFTNRCSTMYGALIISNGDFRVTGTARFPNVPEIYIGTNGLVTCTSTRSGAFASCTNLTVDGRMTFSADVPSPFGYKNMRLVLGEDAELTLPTDAPITVHSLRIGDREFAEGESSADCPQIKAGSIVVESRKETVEATWTGEGADDALSTAGNWSASPIVTGNGTIDATFASGGSRADVTADAIFHGLTLDSPTGDFTIAGSGKKIALREGVFTFRSPVATADAPRAYRIEPQLELHVESPMDLAVGENVTLDFAGGIREHFSGSNVKTGAGTLKLGGTGDVPGSFAVTGGAFRISGDWAIEGALALTNTETVFSGSLAQPGGIIGGNYSKTENHDDYVWIVSDGVAPIGFDGFSCEKRMYLYAKDIDGRAIGDKIVYTVQDSTNELKAHVMLNPQYLTLGRDSVMRFTGGVEVGHSLIISAESSSRWADVPALVDFAGPVTKIDGWSGVVFNNGVCARFGSSGNAVQPLGSSSYVFWAHSRCEATVDDIFDTDADFEWELEFAYTSTFDLGTTSQYIGGNMDVWENYTNEGQKNVPVMTGRDGSRLRLNKGCLTAWFQDGLSLVCEGTNYATEVLLKSSVKYDTLVSTTHGDVEVKSGQLRYMAGVSWPNATNVTVRADGALPGRLVLEGAAFGKHSVFRVDSGAQVDLADGVYQRCAELWIDGERMQKGRWGKPGSGAEHTAECFTGDGILRVDGHYGLAFSIR